MAEKKGRGKIASLVEEILREPVEQAGYLLWDVDFYKEGADFNLLVTIENHQREKAIDLEDCEKISRLISPLLDAKDPIEESYYLEVSSPGLERELTRPEHFQFFLGQEVSVRLYAAKNGTKSLAGILSSYEEGNITLTLPGEEKIALEKSEVAKVMTRAKELEGF